MNDMNEVLKKIKEEREELKKQLKAKDEELEKMFKEKNEELQKVIMELEEERSGLEDFNSTLCAKISQSNDEIQEAHKELITGLRGLSGESSKIRVKIMGKVDEKPFLKACEQRFSAQDVALQSAMLCSEWQECVTDSRWYPFKQARSGDKIEDIVDEEDEKLKNLREEWGEEVKDAVKTALEELYEFNGSGRYQVPVLWNFEHGRRATLKEGIVAHSTHQLKNLKRKRA